MPTQHRRTPKNNSQQTLLRMSGDCASDPALTLPPACYTAAHGAPAHNVKSRVAAISIFASAGMAAAKFAVGIAIGSLALISEALHSSVDVVATVITWLVVRVSDRPADDEHHYGHGKFESLSALGVIALLYVLAGGILVEVLEPAAAKARRRRRCRRSRSWCW